MRSAKQNWLKACCVFGLVFASCTNAFAQVDPFEPPYAFGLSPATVSWSDHDARFLRRNRRVAAAGKVLTVVGRISALSLSIAGTTFRDPAYWAFVGASVAGELTWSSADLRATKRLEGSGLHLRRGAAVAAVVGAVLLAPLTWIAGPIASARIREARGDLKELGFTARGAPLDVRGAGFVLKF